MRHLQEGDLIQITWLPNPPNHPSSKNCHICSKGKVTNLDSRGSMYLIMESGATLILWGRYKYEYIKTLT